MNMTHEEQLNLLAGIQMAVNAALDLNADLRMVWKRDSFIAQVERKGALLFGNGIDTPEGVDVTVMDVSRVLKTLALTGQRWNDMEREP